MASAHCVGHPRLPAGEAGKGRLLAGTWEEGEGKWIPGGRPPAAPRPQQELAQARLPSGAPLHPHPSAERRSLAFPMGLSSVNQLHPAFKFLGKGWGVLLLNNIPQLLPPAKTPREAPSFPLL